MIRSILKASSFLFLTFLTLLPCSAFAEELSFQAEGLHITFCGQTSWSKQGVRIGPPYPTLNDYRDTDDKLSVFSPGFRSRFTPKGKTSGYIRLGREGSFADQESLESHLRFKALTSDNPVSLTTNERTGEKGSFDVCYVFKDADGRGIIVDRWVSAAIQQAFFYQALYRNNDQDPVKSQDFAPNDGVTQYWHDPLDRRYPLLEMRIASPGVLEATTFTVDSNVSKEKALELFGRIDGFNPSQVSFVEAPYSSRELGLFETPLKPNADQIEDFAEKFQSSNIATRVRPIAIKYTYRWDAELGIRDNTANFVELAEMMGLMTRLVTRSFFWGEAINNEAERQDPEFFDRLECLLPEMREAAICSKFR